MACAHPVRAEYEITTAGAEDADALKVILAYALRNGALLANTPSANDGHATANDRPDAPCHRPWC